MAFLDWLQNNAIIGWIHSSESLLGYTLYLAFHTIGMVFLVGPSLIIAARVLGLAPGLPLKPMAAFRPVMKVGFWITLITGTVLFATDGVRYVHNGVFIVKIVALVVALFCLQGLLSELFDREVEMPSRRARTLTITLLLMWAIGVVAGRLTAYSGVVVYAAVVAFLTLLAVIAVAAYVARLVSHRRGTHAAPARSASFRIDVQPTPVKGGK